MDTFLPILWFVLIAVLWTGFLFLEGFDLGIGMLLRVMGRDDRERRVMINTIGPVWDGNEVWLLTAGGAMFAAFPMWYASLFSALYIPLVLVLLGLILRGVAIDYRGKGASRKWRGNWDWAMSIGSFLAAFGIGAGLALTTTGLPINANGDREAGPFAFLNVYAIMGGLAVVGFSMVHALVFLSLKTDGELRHRSRALALKAAPVALLPIVAWVLVVQFRNDKLWTLLPIVLAVAAVVFAWTQLRQGREGKAFLGMGAFLVLGSASIFGNAFPVVLPSTLNPDFNLTITNASSSPYTLGIMTIVAAVGVPVVLAYQAWTYWIFRKRISVESIPAHG